MQELKEKYETEREEKAEADGAKAQEGAALFFGPSQNPRTQAFLQGYEISDAEAET